MNAPKRIIHRDIALENLKGFVKKASDVPEPIFISTGHFALDLAIAHGLAADKVDMDTADIDINNIGGLPLGKLAEVYGPEASGKSSIAYRIVGFAQKMGCNCMWIDAENSFSTDLADINGVDRSSLYLSELFDPDDPDKMFYAEDIMELICTSAKDGFSVIVLDSVASLTTKAEMENEIGQGGVGMGALAQLMARAVKKVCNYAAKYNCLVIMINQVREKIGVMFGDPESTPGGKALKFHASIRLRLQKQASKDGLVTVEGENGEDNVIAGKSYVQIKKNRFGKPVQESIVIPIYYEHYFPNVEEILFDAGRQTKLISIRKGVYSWLGIKAEGRKAFIDMVKEQHVVDQLAEAVKAEAKTLGLLLSPEVMAYENSKSESEDERQVPRRRKGKNSGSKPEELWNPEGIKSLEYLRNARGLSDEIIRKFEIGYCPESVFHELSGRIIMPLYNSTGTEIVAFTSRDPTKPKKWQHWHESFEKSRYIYGFHHAIEAIKKQDKVIIVEGQFDVLCLHTFGFNMAVGLCGHALNIKHIVQLARYCSEVYLLLDPDESGDMAVASANEMYQKYLEPLQRLGVGIRFITVKLPKGYDPDDYVRKFGVDSMIKLLKEAKEQYA